MTEERLIAGITVTDGGAPDGQELPCLLYTSSMDNHIET